jgi:hypothetical protein
MSELQIGDEFTYRAINGHMMTVVIREVGDDGRPRYHSWEAWHDDNCHCGGTESLPDW